MTQAQQIRTVALTGATGFVGQELTRQLLAQGYAVRALLRRRAKATEVLPRDARLSIVVGDVLDARSVDELLGGAQACINLVGIIRESRTSEGTQTFRGMHTEATRTLVARCEALGVRRFVQMSALGVKDLHVSEYQKTKFEAEAIVRRSKLDWTIFRPGMIHGPGSEIVQAARNWATGLEPPYLFLPYFSRSVEDKTVPLGGVEQAEPLVAPVAVEDVAGAFVKALSTTESVGEIYNLAGPERLSWPQMLTFIRDNVSHANERLMPFGIPSEVAAIAATAAEKLGVGSFLPFDAGMARMGGEDSVASNEKARADLGYAPRPFRASFKVYADRI